MVCLCLWVCGDSSSGDVGLKPFSFFLIEFLVYFLIMLFTWWKF